MHGLGNDFVIIDSLEEERNMDYFRLALKVCNRNFGVGADGLVVLLPSKAADLTMRIFNSDGSEAEMCGNAIRCAAKYVYENKLVSYKRIKISTLSGVVIPEVITNGEHVEFVKVNMGEPRLRAEQIPTTITDKEMILGETLKVEDQEFKVTCVSMGNPHCIIYVDNVGSIPLELWGPMIEKSTVFPAHTNVEFVEILGPGEVKMRVWERGAGATMACGTGASAVAVAGVLNGLGNRDLRVNLPGGALDISWDKGDNCVYMTGPAEYVFKGTLL